MNKKFLSLALAASISLSSAAPAQAIDLPAVDFHAANKNFQEFVSSFCIEYVVNKAKKQTGGKKKTASFFSFEVPLTQIGALVSFALGTKCLFNIQEDLKDPNLKHNAIKMACMLFKAYQGARNFKDFIDFEMYSTLGGLVVPLP